MRFKKILLLFPIVLGVFSLFQGIFLNSVMVDVDYLFQQVPFRSFSHHEILAGRLPYVYPYSLLGVPLIAHGQIGIFFPLTFITLLLKNQFVAYYIELVLLFVLGFAGEYLFSSLYLEDTEDKIIAALFYAFSPFIFVHIIHLNLIIPFMLLPYSLYLVGKTEDNNSPFAILALVFMLCFLAFHPQAAMMHAVIVLIYSTVNRSVKRTVWTFLAMFMGFLMAGVQVLPFVLLRFSGKFVSHEGFSWMAQGSFDPFISFPLFFIPLPYLRAPLQNTSTNGEIYLYITGFFGLFHYFAAKIWRHKGKELLFISVLGIFLMIVKYNPLYILLSKVPLLNTVRGHIRWWGGILPFVSIMMVMGLKEASEKINLKRDFTILFMLPIFWLWYLGFTMLALHEKWFYLFNIKDRSNIAAFVLWSFLLLLLTVARRKRKKMFIAFLSLEILIFSNTLYSYAKKDRVMNALSYYKSYRKTRIVGVPLDIKGLDRLFRKENSEILNTAIIFGTFFHGNFSYFLPAFNVLGYVAPQLEPVYTDKMRNLIYQGFYLNKNPDEACKELLRLDVNYLMSFTPVKDTTCLALKEKKNNVFIYSVMDTDEPSIFYKDGVYLIYNRSIDSVLYLPLRYIPGLYISSEKKNIKFELISDYVLKVHTNGSRKIVIGYRPLWFYYGLTISIIGVVLFLIILMVRKKE